MRSHPGKTVSIYDIPAMVNTAYLNAMTPANVLSGFRSTGIYPFNRDIFADAEFAPATVSDRPDPGKTPAESDTEPPVTVSKQVPDNVASSSVNAQQAGSGVTGLPSTPCQSRPNEGYVSPMDIMPFPKAAQRKMKGQRKRGKTRILTDTPEKAELERVYKERKQKRKKKPAKKQL